MQSLTLEFDDQEAVKEAAKELWEKLKLTGELHLHQTNAGVWRLELQSERPIRQQTLERIGGKAIQQGADDALADAEEDQDELSQQVGLNIEPEDE